MGGNKAADLTDSSRKTIKVLQIGQRHVVTPKYEVAIWPDIIAQMQQFDFHRLVQQDQDEDRQ
jgi:hypothetical protein